MSPEETIVKYLASHIEKEDCFLYPDPKWIIVVDAKEVFDLIAKTIDLSEETIGKWIEEAQGIKS